MPNDDRQIDTCNAKKMKGNERGGEGDEMEPELAHKNPYQYIFLKIYFANQSIDLTLVLLVTV